MGGELLRILISSPLREMSDCLCLNKIVVALTPIPGLLSYKREIKVKVYCKKVVRWLPEEL